MSQTQQYSPNCESRQEYRGRITTMADIIVDEHDEYDTEITEMVFDEVDSSRFVMFTHEAISALKYSASDPHEWKHLVADDSAWYEVIQAMAFDVVRQDLYDELSRRDEIDW